MSIHHCFSMGCEFQGITPAALGHSDFTAMLAWPRKRREVQPASSAKILNMTHYGRIPSHHAAGTSVCDPPAISILNLNLCVTAAVTPDGDGTVNGRQTIVENLVSCFGARRIGRVMLCPLRRRAVAASGWALTCTEKSEGQRRQKDGRWPEPGGS